MNILNQMPVFKRLILLSAFFLSCTTAHAQVENTDEEAISQAELEQILAPIALYPDSILSHILVAATYPLEIVQAERWLLRNPELQGREAVEASEEQDWDPSVRALIAFPQVLKRMSQDLDWTQTLGDAFLLDEEQVLASVQNLRELASQAGSLDDMEKVTVTREDRTIIIEPREREVVYVPYYDTRVVYGPWRWRNYDPIYWDYPYADSFYYDDYYVHNRRSAFYWGPRISLSFGFFSNTFHWRNRHLVRISSRHYRPHRYYNHYDILDHRYAQRWVHDARRRHAHRNRHIVRRDYRNTDRVHANTRQQSEQSQQVLRGQASRQEQIRNQLTNRRNSSAAPRNTTRVVTSQSRTVSNNRSTSTSSYPTRDSRVVLPSRARAVEESRRSANRPVRQQTTRQATVQRQANRATTSQQARPVQRTVQRAAQTQTARPTPKPVARRPAAPAPKPVVAERRAGPKKAQSATRRETRQPR